MSLALLPTPYVPWSMQRKFHRSRAPIRVIVAGRRSGKTHCASEEVVRTILERPGTDSCLLMPTYKSTKGTLRHLRRALAPVKHLWRWKEVDKVFAFANGAKLYVRTDDLGGEGTPTRGLDLDGVLWIDEAAYVRRKAWDAASMTLGAVDSPQCIITTTPNGRNWVYEEFMAGVPGSPGKIPMNESFRFRSTDSPFVNKQWIADRMKKMGRKRALQEMHAYFLQDSLTAFDAEDIARNFAPRIAVRGKRMTLGVDLGKQQDYTVCVLQNEFGETWVAGRWRGVEWPDQEKRIGEIAEAHGALVVLDKHAGGGAGGTMYDYLARSLGAERIHGVLTGTRGAKGAIIQLLQGDIEAGRLSIQQDARGEILRHEMIFFEQHRVESGKPDADAQWRYHGPTGSVDASDEDDGDVHDDCVIALALANWGRVNAWEDVEDPLAGDFGAFDPGATKIPGASYGGFGELRL